jgi:hypothetical protein
LVEVKYGTNISGKQKELFDKFEVEQKIIIKGYEDINKLKNLLV